MMWFVFVFTNTIIHLFLDSLHLKLFKGEDYLRDLVIDTLLFFENKVLSMNGQEESGFKLLFLISFAKNIVF